MVAPIQILAGDQHGLNTLQYQPAKIAALEGDWETRPGTPLILFGMPNMEEERTDWAVEIPHLGALILTHSWDGSIRGLKEFPPQDRPSVAGRILGVPDHGGARRADGRRRPVGRVAACARAALYVALAARR